MDSARGGLPYETDGDARRLAQGCTFWILASLRVFPAKRQYVKPPRSRSGFREETQNYAKKNRSQIFFLTCFVYRITPVIIKSNISTNDRFPYPFIYLKPKNGTLFGRSLPVKAIIGSTPPPRKMSPMHVTLKAGVSSQNRSSSLVKTLSHGSATG